MKISQYRKQLYKVGDLVVDTLYGTGTVVDLYYDKDLNWFTYKIDTCFGIKERQNNSLNLFKS